LKINPPSANWSEAEKEVAKMRQALTLIMMIAALLLITTSCASGSNAITSVLTFETTIKSSDNTAQTHLWGYFDVAIDTETQTVEVVVNRQAMFTASITTFLNGNIANLNFYINKILVKPNYIDVDLDVSIRHPFPGLSQFNGYDVRGVFMGDGSVALDYNPDLHYPILGTDQFMLANPMDGCGGPDGYTRWFNKPEFFNPGLFGYTQGKLASSNFDGSATLNAYKYFADDLGKDENLWDWLNDHTNQHGLFSAGKTNTRNYYIRFPKSKGINFGYAVLANWEGEAPKFHPSNTPEAVACNIVDNSDVYYVDPTDNGGNLILDVSLFGWDQQPSTIFIESTVLSVPHEFTMDEMNPIGGTENYSIYHVEIPADNVTSTKHNEFCIIAQYDTFNYTNKLGVPNLADTDKLVAFFRYNLAVNNNVSWTQTWGGTSLDAGCDIAVDKFGNVYLTGCFNSAADFDPGTGKDWHISNGANDIFLSKFDDSGNFVWAKTWGGNLEDTSWRIVTDTLGYVYITGEFYTTVDFDPGVGEDWHTSNGTADVFLSKFDDSGNFVWAKTWGGNFKDRGYGVAIDGFSNVYVTGIFRNAVDFDPSPGEDWRTSNGSEDIFISKFDASGNFLWVNAWGGSSWDKSMNVTVDYDGYIYTTGRFCDTVDFDPGPDEDWHTDSGAYLTKFDASGIFIWAQTWSGYEGFGIAADGFNNIYVANFSDEYGIDLNKFDSLGNLLWNKVVSTQVGYSWGCLDVAVDELNNVYATSAFMDTADFDPGPGVDSHISNGSWDAFLTKLDDSGNFLWVKTWGGNGSDLGWSVTTDLLNNVYVTGGFYVTVDFDPGVGEDWHTSNGNFDIYLSKFLPE